MLISIVAYGGTRLYFNLTAGFRVGHIISDLDHDPKRDVRDLSAKELDEVRSILGQKFHYLGKGTQSYVFLSDDQRYVLKFLKYQRFRAHPLLECFSFIPFLQDHKQSRLSDKQERLDKLFSSWKIAFEHLKTETGLVFVHINKSDCLQTPLVIYDRVGIKHTLNPDQLEFLIQRNAGMLCPTIKKYMQDGLETQAKNLIGDILDMVVSEYHRGLADEDHSLMQNTGVLDGRPVHIDVGQFVIDETMKDINLYDVELFSKTYKFRIWLSKHYPELEAFLTARLYDIIGPKMDQLKPKLKTIDEGIDI